jgi:hypothetical protein
MIVQKNVCSEPGSSGTCLTIIAFWENKIMRIMVGGQLKQKSKKFVRLHLNGKEKKLGMVAHTCYPSYSSKPKIGGPWSRLVWKKSKILSPK